MDIKELKAQAYDCLAAIEYNQNRLMAINKEIAKAKAEPTESTESA